MTKYCNIQTFVHDFANKYVPFFDVEKELLLGNIPLAFKAEYKRRDERYMISKKIKVWGVENQQVLFVTSLEEQVTGQHIEQFTKNIERHFKSYVPSDEDHMSTIFLGVIVTGQPVNKEVLKEVKKYRKVKFMKFGLHGWAEFYLALVHLQEGQVVIHPKGQQFVKPIETMLREERVIE